MSKIRQTTSSNLLPVSRAARHLNLSEQRIRELADSGALPHTRDALNRRLFTPEAVQQFAAARKR